MLLSIIIAIALLSLSYMFALSASHKLRDPLQFQQVLTKYELLPLALSQLLSRTLPVLELLIAAGFLIAPLRQAALVATSALLLIYTLAMLANIARGRRDIDCGCHGPQHSQKIGFWSIARNIALIGLTLLLWRHSELLPLSVASWSVALGGTALVALLFQALGQLRANRQLISRISHHG